MMNHGRVKKNGIVFTTHGTHPWTSVTHIFSSG